MIVQAASKEESRSIGDVRELKALVISSGIVCFSPLLVITLYEVLIADTAFSVHNYLIFVITFFVLFLFCIVINGFDKWQGRKLPLMKRIATVDEKKKIRRNRNVSHHITFTFLDNTRVEFQNVGGYLYKELEQGDQIILEYKRVGKFQKPVYYGHKRFEEK